MAQRIPRDESLSRVHGVGALFSTAYGNVGSSIYYALGVTAAFALGLTPVTFVIAGVIFMFTTASYAESTRLNLVLAVADLCTQIVLVVIGIALVMSPATLVDNVHLGVAPTWGNFA